MTTIKYGDKIDCDDMKGFTFGKLLGRGAFGVCYEVKNEMGIPFAVKFLSKSSLKTKEQIGSLNTEIAIHKSLKHMHIVNFISNFDYLDNLVILMELCSNNSLKHLLRRRRTITEPETRYFTRQIASACQYMHDMKIIHRDLKTDNIFLNDNMNIKVADFGLSVKCSGNGKEKSECGTPLYMAPEIFAHSGYNYKVDLWALGCITYILLIGNFPFSPESRETLTNSIRLNLYNIPLSVSDSASEVIHSLLSNNADDRPTIETLLSMNFYKGFTPETLPISALVFTPRFPYQNSDEKSYEAIRNTIVSGSDPCHGEITRKHLVNLRQKIDDLLSCNNIIPDRPNDPCVDPMAKSECPALSPIFWITKWTITAKYGLGYKLNDDSTGVVLNSGSKMIVIGDHDVVQCIDKEDKEWFCSVDIYPKELTTDIHLLKLFQNHLRNNLAVTGKDMIKHDTESMTHLPYVDAYIRTKKSLLLFLSSGVMQMNVLSDHTKLILCPVMGAVTYVDSEFRTFSMNRLQGNGMTQTLYDRLRYALDMIESVLAIDDIKGDISCVCA